MLQSFSLMYFSPPKFRFDLFYFYNPVNTQKERFFWISENTTRKGRQWNFKTVQFLPTVAPVRWLKYCPYLVKIVDRHIVYSLHKDSICALPLLFVVVILLSIVHCPYVHIVKKSMDFSNCF